MIDLDPNLRANLKQLYKNECFLDKINLINDIDNFESELSLTQGQINVFKTVSYFMFFLSAFAFLFIQWSVRSKSVYR